MPIQHCAAQDSIFRRTEMFQETGSSSPYHDHPRSCRDLTCKSTCRRQDKLQKVVGSGRTHMHPSRCPTCTASLDLSPGTPFPNAACNMHGMWA